MSDGERFEGMWEGASLYPILAVGSDLQPTHLLAEPTHLLAEPTHLLAELTITQGLNTYVNEICLKTYFQFGIMEYCV